MNYGDIGVMGGYGVWRVIGMELGFLEFIRWIWVMISFCFGFLSLLLKYDREVRFLIFWEIKEKYNGGR